MKTAWYIQLVLATMVGVWTMGCQAPASTAQPTLADITAETPDEVDQLWNAAEDTLRRYNLPPDRRDRIEGVITTSRATSAAWFEFWKPQPSPAYYWAESNTHTIQRQACVRIIPDQNTPAYQVSVQVDRYRYSLEERQVDNAAGALRLYSSAAPTYSGQNVRPEKSSSWIPLGRDVPMERAILNGIIQAYGKSTVADTTLEEIPATEPSPPAGG